MLQAAYTHHLNSLVPRAHNSECPNLLFPLKITPCKSQFKVKLADFYILHPRHQWVNCTAEPQAQMPSSDVPL